MISSSGNRLQTARRRFFDDGTVPRGLVPDTILRSWQRCTGMGLSAGAKPHTAPLAQRALREAIQRHETLRRLCMPELQGLYADARATGSIVILTAPDGLILEALGNADFLDKAARVSLTPGVPWSENATGTNAIGTAIIESRPVEVRGGEHFYAPHRLLSCSAVPIIDPFGNIAGVLDLSGEASVPHVHALGMVRLAVDQIEHRMFDREFPGCRTLRIQRDARILGTTQEGILVFDGERLAAANRHGLSLLGLSLGDIGRRQFEDLFDAKISDIDDSNALRDAHGRLLAMRADATASDKPRIIMPSEPAAERNRTKPRPEPTAEPVFRAGLQRELERATRILAADLPVLLFGETGTGKEVFARELHKRFCPDAPFVAVNCAGLPESLIESELFGYEEGAFTGARRRGSKGLLRAADGGILFLDEIGDMPLPLQARLLRVLQEREVVPLGASKPVKVDFALISATHCDLERAVEESRFRSDLYFRISQHAISLPALREQSNRQDLIRRIWNNHSHGHRIELSDQAFDALTAFEWPGNLRQLVGSLRTLIALVGPGNRVQIDDLPIAIRKTLPAQTPAAEQSNAGDSSTLAGITEQAIQAALEATDGNVSVAARRLGISRSTLYRRMR